MHEHANKSILKDSSFKSNWTHLVSMIYLFDGKTSCLGNCEAANCVSIPYAWNHPFSSLGLLSLCKLDGQVNDVHGDQGTLMLFIPPGPGNTITPVHPLDKIITYPQWSNIRSGCNPLEMSIPTRLQPSDKLIY